MNIFYSAFIPEELADIPREERKGLIGYIKDGQIVNPAHCYDCGAELCLTDIDLCRAQCIKCGSFVDIHYYDGYSPLFMKEIDVRHTGREFEID